VFLIVAVSMEELLVGEVLASPTGEGNEMVEFKQVAVFEVESTARATALLHRQQAARGVPGQGMVLEPGSPVDQLAIIDRSVPPYLVVLSHRWDKWHGLVGLARWR
jgi:hypothetical protein